MVVRRPAKANVARESVVDKHEKLDVNVKHDGTTAEVCVASGLSLHIINPGLTKFTTM